MRGPDASVELVDALRQFLNGLRPLGADRMRSIEPSAIHPLPALTGILLAIGMASSLAGQEYHVDLEMENWVRFVSDAPLEDFEGVTNQIDGFLFLAGEGLAGETDLTSSEFFFEVDLASLDTGIGLRNRHMRDNYLETDEFPYASFGGRVSRLEEESSGRFRAEARGTFTVHGVERSREIECAAESIGQGLRIRCAFQVTLSDYGIPIPKLMFMKINEVMEVDLDFFLSPAGGGGGPGGNGAEAGSPAPLQLCSHQNQPVPGWQRVSFRAG